MANNKKIGNQTGAVNLPTAGSAKGAFATSETYRFLALDSWPKPIDAINYVVGDYAFAASSGVATVALSGGAYTHAYGQSLSKASYPELSNVIGTNYGGDVANFNLPNVSSIHSYLKATANASGTSASGILPVHTHNVNGASESPYVFPNTGGNASPPRLYASTTLYTSVDGSTSGNNGKFKEIIPLICLTSSPAVIGFVQQYLLPTSLSSAASALNNQVLIASGQAVSRDAYPELFARIGTNFGAGDGSTTFNLPDYRGVFLRAPSAGAVGEVDFLTSGSGYSADSFAAHRHGVDVNQPVGSSAGSTTTSVGNYLTTPATSNSSIGGSESRPANFTCLTVIIASGAI